jgi:Nif-specific regulatory protein
MYRLRVIGGQASGATFELTPGQYTLGRGADVEVRLADESVSRRHALLTVTAEGVTLLDLDSHNGSCINGRAVKSGRALEGDELEFGDSRLVLERSAASSGATVSVQIVGSAEEAPAAVSAQPPAARPPLPTDSHRLAILYDVGNTINAAVGLPSFLERALATVFEVVPAERGVIMLWEDGERRWVPAAVHTREPAEAEDEIAVSRAIIEEAFAAGGPILSPDAGADTRFSSSDSIETFAIRSAICCPLVVRGERVGVLHLDTRQAADVFTDDDVRLVGAIANQAAIAIANARLHETLRQENISLRRALGSRHCIVGSSAAMRTVMSLVRRVSQTDATVLLRGESGTGKEVVARTVHALSARRGKPFVCVNCAAMPEALLESELFGHEKGAFTGAVERRVGRFELANGGTIFLDEIGEMSPGTQAKILRVLQEQEFRRVGGTKPLRVDVRLVASTNRDLEAAIEDQSFREDLYYRIKVIEIVLPPLRERLEDIPELCGHFLGEIAREMGRQAPEVAAETIAALQSYPWRGNVRELRNVLERAMVLGIGKRLLPRHLPREVRRGHRGADALNDDLVLAEVERRHVADVLALTGWNKSRAAALMRISRPRLDRKIRDYGLQPPPSQS